MIEINDHMLSSQKIAVIIPTYKVKDQIGKVISSIPDFVWRIYVVDDCCPVETGKYVEANFNEDRLIVLYNAENKGVGGAVKAGYVQALNDGAQIMVKIDGDNQMDAELIPYFVEPIISGEADYTKGNRFWDLEKINAMPKMRLIGNSLLSLMTKFSSGYWQNFDPTNGYTAIHAGSARHLPLYKISNRYFFESDMLFRLNTLRAVVHDIPMHAKYEDEESNLKISKIVGEFLFKHIRNFVKRIFYNYYLRDLSIASLELPIGIGAFIFGLIYGIMNWLNTAETGIATPAGTVMLAALPLLVGVQLLLAFLNYDIASVPTRPISRKAGHKISF